MDLINELKLKAEAIQEIYDDLENLEDDIRNIDTRPIFPYSSNLDQMKVDLLKEHWDKITLDHLDEMVKKL